MNWLQNNLHELLPQRCGEGNDSRVDAPAMR